jgi:uncharacterized protein YqgV (UPF0045/DUF77 family)
VTEVTARSAVVEVLLNALFAYVAALVEIVLRPGCRRVFTGMVFVKMQLRFVIAMTVVVEITQSLLKD